MAETSSTMVALGTPAPDFSLPDTISGKMMSLNDFKSDCGTLIMFLCNHCPFVKYIQKELVNLANDYIPKGISITAISSNDIINYPEDSPENMKQIAMKFNYPFSYLYDETQEVAKAFRAACTPDFFVYDNEFKLIYRGQLDESRPGNNMPITGKDIRSVFDCILNKRPVSKHQIPSIGCNIKWKT